MIGLDVHFEASPWLAALRALSGALDEELGAAVARGAEAVVFAAKADHPYTDYSGDLTRTTKAYAPRGRFSRGDLRVEVVARETYASYVMRRRGDWLMDAYRRNEARVEHEVEIGLEAAVRRAGLAR